MLAGRPKTAALTGHAPATSDARWKPGRCRWTRWAPPAASTSSASPRRARSRRCCASCSTATCPLNLNASDGSVVTRDALDARRRRAAASASASTPTDPALQALLECDEAVVVGYLDSVKLQFDVHDLVLVHGAQRQRAELPLPARAVPLPAPQRASACARCCAARRWRSCATPTIAGHAAGAARARRQHRRLRAVPARRRAAAAARRADEPAC